MSQNLTSPYSTIFKTTKRPFTQFLLIFTLFRFHQFLVRKVKVKSNTPTLPLNCTFHHLVLTKSKWDSVRGQWFKFLGQTFSRTTLVAGSPPPTPLLKLCTGHDCQLWTAPLSPPFFSQPTWLSTLLFMCLFANTKSNAQIPSHRCPDCTAFSHS